MEEQRKRCVEDKRRLSRREVTLVGVGGAFQLGSAPPAARLLAAARWTSMTGPLISGHLHYARNSVHMNGCEFTRPICWIHM